MRDPRSRSGPGPRRVLRPLLGAALLGLAACGGRRSPELPAPARFTAEVRAILAVEHPTPEYYEALGRLEGMGPAVDAVLVTLARDPTVKTTARANALILLADRGSPAALAALRAALFTEEIPLLRSAAVLGLQRLAPSSPAAQNLIRSAVGDASRSVRLNALQALDPRDVATIRGLLQHENDREVRMVAMQLVALAESRGAPLVPDRRGALRTTGPETDPQIVFRPTRADSVAGYAVGDLRVEVPNGKDVPLAPAAEVVAGVVPAFFSPDRSRVVYEADREIRVLDLAQRDIRSLGPGIAPRLIPFTHHFVFVREIPGSRRESETEAKLRYRVFVAEFTGGEPQPIGELTATARMERHGNYSPVRWMVVGETAEGFVLRGEGITPFVLPATVWSSGGSDAPESDPHPPASRR